MLNNILLLHGALGASGMFSTLAQTLQKEHTIHTLDLIGHGNNDDSHEHYSIPMFAEQVVQYLAKNEMEETCIFGYSMGGYVGMYLAKYYPSLVKKLVTLATKFHWDDTTAAREVKFLDVEVMEKKVPDFVAQLQQRHKSNWKEVVEKTRNMLLEMGQKNPLSLKDYSSIKNPSLLMLGDRDRMVTLEETVAVFNQLPAGELGILPATPHPFEQVDTGLLATLIRRFIYQPIP